ncbi:hypothetical protein L1987_85674 [Smallanthus sonchifolius]|uniref:Uncharacterized protein n=1 Tax=Smallanthus sonchifolius TaxID=185202 RepID=A0ACB8XXT0_9ASTR|nr:hypothetical protein L1987_85674 [Smallanthus sonchifolius]
MINQRKKLRSEIQLWLKNVEKLVAEVKQIETEIEKCMKGCFPNYISRYRLGKMVEKPINDMSELRAKGVFPNGLFIDSFQDSGRILPTGLVVCRGMETQREIKVDLLTKNEAWDLFTAKSGPICWVNLDDMGQFGLGPEPTQFRVMK